MGLAVSQARLLTLTSRKADCEFNIGINQLEKTRLAQDSAKLASEYNSKLRQKQVCYFDGNNYQKMNYSYIMGGTDASNSSLTYSVMTGQRISSLKPSNDMVLTDYRGYVVLSPEYAEAIVKAFGGNYDMSNAVCGKPMKYNADALARFLSEVCCWFSLKDYQTVIAGGTVDGNIVANEIDRYGNDLGKANIKISNTEEIKNLINFYKPIFMAAITNGWTKEYNTQIQNNDSYISDALNTGIFRLEEVNAGGGSATTEGSGVYKEGTTLQYFLLSNQMSENSTSEYREELTAWYEAEKADISFKEGLLDVEINNLSTELEAIKTETESLKSLIDDATSSVFDWGAA